jgi:hypothetical protein
MMTDTPPRPARAHALRGRGARLCRASLLQLLEHQELIVFEGTDEETGTFSITIRHRPQHRQAIRRKNDLDPQVELTGAEVERFFRGFQAGLAAQEIVATDYVENSIALWSPEDTWALGFRHGVWCDSRGQRIVGTAYEDEARELLSKLTR